MIDPQDYFFVEEIIFPECGGVTGENESMNETQAPESQAIESDDRDNSQSTKSTAELSPSQARRLIATSEYSIDLDELSEVSLEVALILARFKGDISLAGLHRLEPAAAQAFRVHRASLSLNGL